MTDPRYPNARTPPYSLDAEQAVLGALMLSEEAYFKISDKVVGDDFYRQDHRIIFKAIAALKEKGQPCDAVTLGEWLENKEQAEAAGGIGYVIEIANNTPGAANIVAYAEIVREKSILRQLMEAGTQIVDDILVPEGRSSEELLQGAEKLVFDIGERGKRGRGSFVPISEALKEAYRAIEFRYSNKGTLNGLDTGFVDLNTLTNGLQGGDLVIVAARPAMGKTSFAMNIAEHAAIQSGQPVAIFSLEMPVAQLALRMISSLGRVDQKRLRNGDLADEDWPRVTSAITLLTQAKLFIDDTGGLSPSELRARTRRLKREHGLALIVVDYLQLMQVPGTKENRTNEISEISRNLKAIAKEMNVPVIALSQLNRSLEQRQDKRPMMADLRESGAIEQDADIICFIYRDEYYNPDSPKKGTAEIIVAKHRNGPTGSIDLWFRGQYTRFDSIAREAGSVFDSYG
jgi:replicative DNA helicase